MQGTQFASFGILEKNTLADTMLTSRDRFPIL